MYLDGLLIVEKHIVTFVDKITAVIEKIFGSRVAERVAEKHAHPRAILFKPRPEGIIIEFVNPDHV